MYLRMISPCITGRFRHVSPDVFAMCHRMLVCLNSTNRGPYGRGTSSRGQGAGSARAGSRGRSAAASRHVSPSPATPPSLVDLPAGFDMVGALSVADDIESLLERELENKEFRLALPQGGGGRGESGGGGRSAAPPIHRGAAREISAAQAPACQGRDRLGGLCGAAPRQGSEVNAGRARTARELASRRHHRRRRRHHRRVGRVGRVGRRHELRCRGRLRRPTPRRTRLSHPPPPAGAAGFLELASAENDGGEASKMDMMIDVGEGFLQFFNGGGRLFRCPNWRRSRRH